MGMTAPTGGAALAEVDHHFVIAVQALEEECGRGRAAAAAGGVPAVVGVAGMFHALHVGFARSPRWRGAVWSVVSTLVAFFLGANCRGNETA